MSTETLSPTTVETPSPVAAEPAASPATPVQADPSASLSLKDLTTPEAIARAFGTPQPKPDPVAHATEAEMNAAIDKALETDLPPVEGDAPPVEGEAANAPPPVEKEPVFEVEVPLPQRGEPGDPTGLLKLALPTQEAADTLRHHLKQSARVSRLEGQIEQASGDRAVVDFLEQKPLEGILWMAEQNPEAGAKFLDLYLRANPEAAVTAMRGLGYQVGMDTATERALLAEQRLAQLEAQQAVQNGRSTFQQGRQAETIRVQAQEVVQDISATLGMTLESEDYALFAARCSHKVAAVFQEKGRATTKADITAAIQPVVQAFTRLSPTATPVKVHHSAEQPRAEDGTFAKEQAAKAEALRQKNERLRRLGGPTGNTAAALVEKIQPTDSLYSIRNQGTKSGPYVPGGANARR